jgi:hypothetical protein
VKKLRGNPGGSLYDFPLAGFTKHVGFVRQLTGASLIEEVGRDDHH